MQRSVFEKRSYWSQNRASSIIMIGLSLIATMIVIKLALQVVSLSIKQAQLENIKQNLIEEIEDLERRNEYLSDSDYYNIYIQGDYQIGGNNILIIPQK